jgi:hypothetical protein
MQLYTYSVAYTRPPACPLQVGACRRRSADVLPCGPARQAVDRLASCTGGLIEHGLGTEVIGTVSSPHNIVVNDSTPGCAAS